MHVLSPPLVDRPFDVLLVVVAEATMQMQMRNVRAAGKAAEKRASGVVARPSASAVSRRSTVQICNAVHLDFNTKGRFGNCMQQDVRDTSGS